MNGISVIIPFYNVKKEYLIRCLESIKIQNYSYLEVILVNDGSTKDCSYLKKYNYKIINTEHLGVSNARNVGINNASFENIVFIDADDTFVENAFNIFDKYINLYNDYEIIIFDAYVYYEKIKVNNKFYKINGKLTKKDIIELELQSIYKNFNYYKPSEISVGPVWAKVYKKKFLLKNKLVFFNELRKCQDTLFNLYAFDCAKKVYYISEYVYNYYKNINSSCNNYLHNIENTRYYFIKEFINNKNKNKNFTDALNLGVIENLYIILNKHIFIKSNLSYYNKLKQVRDITRNKLYSDAIKYSNGKNLKEKIFIYFLKKENFFMVGFLIKIKQILLKINKKNIAKR